MTCVASTRRWVFAPVTGNRKAALCFLFVLWSTYTSCCKEWPIVLYFLPRPISLMPVPVPDPSSNNSFKDFPEPVTQVGRKRLRSQSMQSDSGASSSSVKRSVADNSANESQIRSPRPDQPSPLTPTDLNQDTDAYMAEQDEAEVSPFMAPPSLSQTSPPVPMISREDKFSGAQTGKGRKMQVGETWYLVSTGWYKRFVKACTGEIDKAGPVNEEDLGPVNNSSLLDAYGNLLPSLAEGVDVEYVPQEVWNQLIEWCVSSVSMRYLLLRLFH